MNRPQNTLMMVLFTSFSGYAHAGIDFGACCAFGSCSIVPEFGCPGTYLGDGTSCSPGICDQFTDGACCRPDGTCFIGDVFECTVFGGTFNGVGSTCEAAVCTGACCVGDGTCGQDGPAACTGSGGTFFGLGSDCSDANCLGACCEGDGFCSEVGPDTCDGFGGSFYGLDSFCEDVNCLGACCAVDGTCSTESEDDCIASGGSFSGQGTTCAETMCPVPTPITYQGRLDLDGNPYTGLIDLEFRLMDDPAGGSQVGSTIAGFDVSLENGLFTELLDFGVEVFTGSPRWLEITVVTDTGAFTLAPRQLLTSVPYALQTRGLFVDEDLNVGVGTTEPLASLHVRGNGEFRGQHIAYFESMGESGDGIAIQLDNAHTNIDNNYVTFYNGDGNVTGRIEGFDLQNGDWQVPPPIPTLGFTMDFDPGSFPTPSFNPGSIPTATFSPGSLPSLSLSTTSIAGVSVVTGANFSAGTLPFLQFSGGFLPSLSFSGGELPSVSGVQFELPTLEELDALMCWAKTYDLEEFVTLDPVSLAAEALKAAATQQCLDEGIVYGSKGADYAEWLPKENPSDRFQLGQLIGVTGGEVSLNTDGAERIMAVSHAPVVLGNTPPTEQIDDFVKVAFMGQVKVVVRGVVETGDYIVSSGLNDGTGVAVSPDELTYEHLGQVLGRAWSASENDVYSLINVLVGMGHDAAVEISMKQQVRITELEARNQSIENRLARIETLIESSR